MILRPSVNLFMEILLVIFLKKFINFFKNIGPILLVIFLKKFINFFKNIGPVDTTCISNTEKIPR